MSGIPEGAVSASVKQQGAPTFGMFDSVNVAEDNNVVAAFHDIDPAAFNIGQAARKDRTAAVPGVKAPVLEFVLLRAGEILRQIALVLPENIDRESLALAKRLQASDGAGQADQDQRRVKGNGRKGVDGDADGFAFGRQAGGHGDSGGKISQRRAEFISIECHTGTSLLGGLAVGIIAFL